MKGKIKYQKQTRITSTMLICLVIIYALFFSFLIKFDENSEKFSIDLKLSGISVNTTEVVSTESTGNSLRSSIDVDGAGNVHVVWDDFTDYSGSGGNGDIFYKRWNATSSTWTITEVLSTEYTDHGSYYPSIAVDSAGNVHVVWYSSTGYGGSGGEGDIFYKRWNATSSTWIPTEVVSTESTSWSSLPSIAVDGAGNAHIVWVDDTNYNGSGTDQDIFYKRWNATSSTWTITEVVSTESTSYSSRPTIAVDGVGNAHVAWQDDTNYNGSGSDTDIFYKRWNATTSTWTLTEVVSTESTSYSGYPTIAVEDAGNVHLAWFDPTNYFSSGMDDDIFYKRWNATSSTWTLTEVVSTESTSKSRWPSIVVDGVGNADMAWQDETNYNSSGSDIDIFYKRWDATTSTWTLTEVVSTESTSISEFPSIAVDGVGNAHVAWQDDTNYNGSGSDTDIFYKRWNATSGTWTPDGLITITNPSGFVSWETGTNHSISWTSTGSITNVKIELYISGVFDSVITSSTLNDGELLWIIPFGLANSSQYQIKITDVSNPTTYDSTNYFEVYTPLGLITITNPSGLVSWETGTNHSITWISIGSITNVKIELYISGTFDSVITSSTLNDGELLWTIPFGLANSSQYQIKITDVSNPTTYDSTDYFEIYTPPDSGSSSPSIPGYDLLLLIGISSLIAIFLIRKQLMKNNFKTFF